MNRAAMPKDDLLLDEEPSPGQEKEEKPPASRPSTPSSFAALTPLSPHYAWDSDSLDSASASDQSLTASTSTAQSRRSKEQWRNWPNLLTGLLVDVRDTIANRLIENDEYVADTDEYFLKLKNRLHHNDERRFESLHLHLHPHNPPALTRSLDDLHTACQMDKTVRHLTFRVGMYEYNDASEQQQYATDGDGHLHRQTMERRRWNQAQIQQFSQALLSLPKLEKLELCYYLQGSMSRGIPVQDLIRGLLFKQHPELPPSRLQCLEIHHLHLLSQDDTRYQLIGLAHSALQNNSMLREFRLGTISSCLVQVVELDPLFHVLSTLPNLQQVEFIDQALNSFCFGGVTLESSTLAAFLKQAPALKALKINEESFEWNDEAILQMADVLQTNTTLETLELRRDVGSYLKSLGRSTLQRMGLAQIGTKVTSKGYDALVGMLEQNYTLKDLHVYGNGKYSNRATSSTFATRNNRSTCSSANQQGHHLQDSNGLQAAETISRCNQNGGHGEVNPPMCYDQDFERRISFYLKLNRDGRKLLMRHEDYREWVEAVIAHRDELDCLFHVLSSNPCVIILMFLRRG